MREVDIESFIDKLKIYFKIDTDEELASKLDMTQPAITHWRRRGVPKKIIRRYQEKISGEKEEIVVGSETIHIEKGEEKVDANYIIELQKHKIESQKRQIDRLNAVVDQQKIVREKPAFHFKTKAIYDVKSNSFGKSEVTGDTSMTGYTKEFLSNLKPEEWFAMYHPESANVLVSSVPTELPDHTHNMYENILWKAKNNKYRVYNIETFFNKKEGVVRSYYYWVNGDVEGQS